MKEPLQEGSSDTVCEVLLYHLCNYLNIPCCEAGLLYNTHSYSIVDEERYRFMVHACDFLHISEGNIYNIWDETERRVHSKDTYFRIIQMYLLDILTRQVDRNTKNFSFVVSNKKVELYPMYDNGLSLFSLINYNPSLNFMMRTKDMSEDVLVLMIELCKKYEIEFIDIFEKDIDENILYELWQDYLGDLHVNRNELVAWVCKQYLNIKNKFMSTD